MGLGQYDSLRDNCGPHTAISVFLININTHGALVACLTPDTGPFWGADAGAAEGG